MGLIRWKLDSVWSANSFVVRGLKTDRFPRDRVRWHEIHPHIHSIGDWGTKPIPGHCLCCCRWSLRSPGGSFYGSTSHQAQVRSDFELPLSLRSNIIVGNSVIIRISRGTAINQVRQLLPGFHGMGMITRDLFFPSFLSRISLSATRS